MSLLSWGLAKAARLPRPEVTRVLVERDLEVKMSDGEVLLADRWYAPATVRSAPIILVRSPYGRRQIGFVGRLFSERGYQCVIQSCRGTFGSGGVFDPFRHERADGLATLEWLASEPWFSGAVGTFGPSYLGLTQWSVAAGAPEFLQAMALSITASRFREGVVYPGGTFSLETGATWVDFLEAQERGTWHRLRAMTGLRKRTAPAYACLPLRDADGRTLGHRIPFYQDWLVHELDGDPWWDPVDFSHDLTAMPPASLVAGWYDLFLAEQVRDYLRLRDAGRETRLTIGPWTHTNVRVGVAALRDALDWFDLHLRSRPTTERPGGVRLYVLGADRWVELPDWPPPASEQRWHLHPGGRLHPRVPDGSPPDAYRYDPADPTPGVGGASLDLRNAGPRKQGVREERPDVLCYTSDPCPADLTLAGPLKAEVWVRTSQPHIDVFVRLCDVDRSGVSRNISDGVLRVDPDRFRAADDGTRRVRISMAPTAITFRRGHRLRVQVSSGAHPLFARNTGSGERLATAARLVATNVEIFHDPDHPSAIDLPVSPICHQPNMIVW
jgi:putative CocE/NonD family hydrolase